MLFPGPREVSPNGATWSWPIRVAVRILVYVGSYINQNPAALHKRINNIRGNHTLEDAGLTLKVRPYVPSARPFHEIVRTNLTFPEWGFFVKKKSCGLVRRFWIQWRVNQ